jgi:hypothetical protein
VRLADAVFRGGHLSERALVATVMTGERPVHFDRCDICAERAVELGRWLDQVREIGLEAADGVFTPEQLAAQQAHIMRRLEQLDQPARVIAFPSQSRLQREAGGRRVAAAWLAVAAAAGLALGVLGTHVTGWLTHSNSASAQATIQQPAAATAAVPTPTIQPAPSRSTDAPLLKLELDGTPSRSLDAMDEMTPSLTPASNVVLASNRSGGF